MSLKNDKAFVGIGLKPEYCGKGYGYKILSDGMDKIIKRYPQKELYLEVRSWNLRAIKLYKKVGFVFVKNEIRNNCKYTIMKYIND